MSIVKHPHVLSRADHVEQSPIKVDDSSVFAVVAMAGKQYKVTKNDVFVTSHIPNVDIGDKILIDDVSCTCWKAFEFSVLNFSLLVSLVCVGVVGWKSIRYNYRKTCSRRSQCSSRSRRINKGQENHYFKVSQKKEQSQNQRFP